MNDLLWQAFLTLHVVFALPMPNDMPQVIEATEAQMPCSKCTSAYRSGVVWVRGDQPRDVRWKSQLLHEARHHLQYEAKGMDAVTCEDWLDRERAAYSVQILYLEKMDVHPLAERLVLESLNCRKAQ